MKKLNTLIIGSGASGLAAAVRLDAQGVKNIAIYTEGLGMGTSINTGSDKQTYCERDLMQIDIGDMPSKQRKKYVGIHTYNINDNYEVIDFKNKSKFRLGNAINIFYRAGKHAFRR